MAEEKELYQLIRGTEMEARLPLMDLYGLLHLPFSTREPELIKQWKNTVEAIVTRERTTRAQNQEKIIRGFRTLV